MCNPMEVGVGCPSVHTRLALSACGAVEFGWRYIYVSVIMYRHEKRQVA